jgi:hypothetical protein
VDIWDRAGDSIVESRASTTSRWRRATCRAAIARWPASRMTLRQGARVVHESGQRQGKPDGVDRLARRDCMVSAASTTLADFERHGIPKSVFL